MNIPDYRRGLTLIILVILTSACASSGASSSPVTGKVPGVMHDDSLATTLGDAQALHKLSTSSVYCGWQDDHVVLHARFKNGLAAHVTIHVSPVYVLENAGKHGDGAFNEKSVGVDAGASRDWLGDLGAPAGGVKAGTAITRCAPLVAYVELG